MAPLISKIVSGIGFARSKGKILASGGSIKIFENYTYHVFTSPAVFNLTGAIDQIEYLIIGGGGGTGYYPSVQGGGGGGAGGFRTGTTNILPGSYPVSVGTGGASAGGNGGSSSAFSIISSGGGGGGTRYYSPPVASGSPGQPGGSGGGGGGGYVFGSNPRFTFAPGGGGGTGNSPPVTPPQGTSGVPGTPGGVFTVGTDGGGGGAGSGGSGTSGGTGVPMPSSFPLSVIGPLMPPSWVSLINTYGIARGGNGSTPNSVASPNIPANIANTGYGGHFPLSPGQGSSGLVIVRYSW